MERVVECTAVEGPRRRLLRLAPELTAPSVARDFVARACAAWHGEQYCELGQLVVSELVSNAVLHSGTAIEVEILLDRDRLWLRVHDESDGIPALVPRGPRAIGGVGLELVSKVAQSWGVTPDPHGGKDVWCALLPSGEAAGRATAAAS